MGRSTFAKWTCKGCGREIGVNVWERHRRACKTPEDPCAGCGKAIVGFAQKRAPDPRRFCSWKCIDASPCMSQEKKT